MRIAFIGGGNMGEAIVSAILSRGMALPNDVLVSDIAEQRLKYIGQKYGVAVTDNNRLAAEKGDVLVMAIKPQNLAVVMADLKGQLKTNRLVLSIIAGARIKTLRLGLDHNSIVRAMPNTPAQIGEGITVWTATAEVTEQQKGWSGSILGAMGKEIYVDDEKYIDMATAVSGSGPAYLFLFTEALISAAEHIGLPSDISRELVLETIAGSARYARQSGRELAELRRMVTSPGGTTAEALQIFEKGGFTALVKQAVIAAYEKAKKLGG